MRPVVIMAWAAVVMGFLTGCASPSVGTLGRAEQQPIAGDLASQRRAVEAALASPERQYAQGLAKLEQASAAEQSEGELERLMAERQAARSQALSPLAAQGNAEAMYRLAADLRDSAEPSEVARWLELTSDAAGAGHPLAHDELARWWWHQKGDGSIEAIQRYRARALDHAEAAADAGYLRSLNRIAVYIAGDVHQYPANLALARELMRLCAQAGSQECQERLALRSTYEFAEGTDDRYFWLAVLAKQQEEPSRARMQVMKVSMGTERAIQLQEEADGWCPTPWVEMRTDWAKLRVAILAHGASGVGSYGACSTATPWCRGNAVKFDVELVP